MACIALTSCGNDRPGGSASGSASGASGKPDGVVIDAAGLHLDGKRLGDAPADKHEGLIALRDALKGRPLGIESPESMGEPSKQTPLAVQLPADVSCLAAMSTLFTAERIGFRKVALTLGDRKETLDLRGGLRELLAPKRLTLAFRGGDKVAITNADCGGAFDVQPLAGVEASAKELVKLTPIPTGPVQVRCEPGVKFADVLEAFVKTRPTSDSPLGALHCDGRVAATRYIGGDSNKPDPDAPKSPWGRDDSSTPTKMAADTSGIDPERVRAGGASITGPLTEPEVQGALRTRWEYMSRCYAAGVAKIPALAGTVGIGFEIGKTGEVMAVENAGSSMPDGGVVGCVLEQAAGASFPAKASTSRITFPIAFSPSDKTK